jgi:hypothetical protein
MGVRTCAWPLGSCLCRQTGTTTIAVPGEGSITAPGGPQTGLCHLLGTVDPDAPAPGAAAVSAGGGSIMFHVSM